MMSFNPYIADRYLNLDEIKSFLNEISASFPKWVKLEIIGRTYNSNDIYLVTIGNQYDNPHEKPAIWLDGGTHCAEWTGIMSNIYTISKWLLDLSNNNFKTIECFENNTAYIIPCISPDGFDSMMKGSPFIRSSLRENNLLLRSGFEPFDINSDKQINFMRWKHPAGPYMIDEELPIMRPRNINDDPDEAYFCTLEGQFTNWDGISFTSAQLKYGMDLNRNFPNDWKLFNMFGMDGGDYPSSEPETKAVLEAFTERTNICAAITNHTYGGCILTQPYKSNSVISDSDVNLMYNLAKDISEGSGYRVYKVYPEFMYKLNEPITGVWSDTISTLFGVPGYTVELWNLFKYLDNNEFNPMNFFLGNNYLEIREMIVTLTNKHPEIVRPWEKFNHPQLGEVEIGGIDYMKSIRNPPESILKNECDKAYCFSERLIKSLPKIKLISTYKKLEKNLYQISVVIENLGYLSTSGLKHGVNIRTTPKVSLKLCLLNDSQLVSGELEQVHSHLSGWGNNLVEDGVAKNPIYPNLSKNSHNAISTWIVRGEGDYKIKWSAGRGGKGEEIIHITS